MEKVITLRRFVMLLIVCVALREQAAVLLLGQQKNAVIGTTPSENPGLSLITGIVTKVHCDTPGAAVVLDKSGSLTYTPDGEGNMVPDFSYAGYMGGGVPIPDVPVRMTVTARTDDPDRDRTSELQEALNAIAACAPDSNGFRGTLLLGKGKYVISDTLRISASGIVVRGSGAGFGGTWIYHKPRVKRQVDLEFIGRGSAEGGVIPTIQVTAAGTVQRRFLTELRPDVTLPCGERVMPVSDASSVAPGMDVIVEVVHSARWLAGLNTPKDWGQRSIVPRMRRFVSAVDIAANTVTLDRPISTRIDRKGGYCEKSSILAVVADTRPSNIGVEDILFISGYDRTKTDKGGYYCDENHPNSVFVCENSTDSWIRRCTAFFYSYNMMTAVDSARITVEDCAMLDGVSKDTPSRHVGSRKYYFHICADDMLVQRCYGRYARHTFAGTGNYEGGVFRDCYSEQDHLASEWHQQWGYGHIFDNVFCHAPIAFRGVSNAIHGQCAAFSLAWNCVIKNKRPYSDLWINRVPGIVNNWASGCLLLGKGTYVRGEDAGGGHHFGDVGTVEYQGAFMPIRSLSLEQLRQRTTDDTVCAVATTSQMNGQRGAVWTELINKYSMLPIWMDPEAAPWPGLENWVVSNERTRGNKSTRMPAFIRAAGADAPISVSIDPAAAYLSDIPEESFRTHGNILHKNKRVGDSNPVSLEGVMYPKSLLVHPQGDTKNGEVIYNLLQTGKQNLFEAITGIEDATGDRGSVLFEVHLLRNGSWEKAWSSLVGGAQCSQGVKVALAGADKIKLICTDGGDGISSDHGTWALARVY